MQDDSNKKPAKKSAPMSKAPAKKVAPAKKQQPQKKEVFEKAQGPSLMEGLNKQKQARNLIRQPPAPQLKLLNDTPENKDKKVVAVIVTFCEGVTYDGLFQTVEQKSLEGTKVEVYACESRYLPLLSEAFEGKPKDELAERLLASIKQVENDCVVFNWECCSGYGEQVFHEGAALLFSFLKRMVDRGYMCMFSDFSLKALINQWQEKYELGPNPFVKTGEFSGMFEIRFNSGQLKECPSAQLQIIGDMAEQGHCNIHALDGTIRYCVDLDKTNHELYKVEVLTVVPGIKSPKKNLISKIGQIEGSAGHVLLRYPSGGMILTSMGHWIELMKIDTSEQKLFQVAEQEFGVEEASRMKEQFLKMDMVSQKEYVSSKAREFVRNQAPCSNMNKKAKKRM